MYCCHCPWCFVAFAFACLPLHSFVLRLQCLLFRVHCVSIVCVRIPSVSCCCLSVEWYWFSIRCRVFRWLFSLFCQVFFYCISLHQLLRRFCLVISHCNCLCLSLLMYCLFPWVFIVSCLQAHWFYVLILRVGVDFVLMVPYRCWCFLIYLSLQCNMFLTAFSF